MKYKKFLLVVSLFAFSACTYSQNQQDKSDNAAQYISIWQGVLQAGEMKLKMIFKFYKTAGDSIGAFMDVPEQGAKDVKAVKVYYGNDSVNIAMLPNDAVYAGKFNKDKTEIAGEWAQSGARFPLTLSRIEKVETVKRPQEPKRPFPYNEEEVTFQNKDAGVTLAGTFAYPKTEKENGKKFPVVVFIAGSGQQTRDEEVYGHKSFLVWSDFLTRNGIAVLRYDKRGVGKSTGNYDAATTMDFSADAIAAVNYIKTRKEVDTKKIGVAGHSEGGLIAPIVANRSSAVSFIILAAGSAVPADKGFLKQVELILRKSGAPEAIVNAECEKTNKIYQVLKNYNDSLDTSRGLDSVFSVIISSLPEAEKNNQQYSTASITQQKQSFLSPWYRQIMKLDPYKELVKLNIPVLAMYGENDLQVPALLNKDEMEKALRKSKSRNYKVIVFPKLNHIFQECVSGLPTEYGSIEQTASPKMLEFMVNWIKEHLK